MSTPEKIRFYGVNYSSLEETEEQMKWYENLEKSGSGMWWAIRLKNSEEFCGAFGFNDYQKENAKAEIGFWLLPEYWGRGYLKETAQTLIEYIFTEIGIHRLEAFVEVKNKNSSRALSSLGFVHEGRMFDAELKDNNYIDIDLYAKLNLYH